MKKADRDELLENMRIAREALSQSRLLALNSFEEDGEYLHHKKLRRLSSEVDELGYELKLKTKPPFTLEEKDDQT